jgi:hypothetical protein
MANQVFDNAKGTLTSDEKSAFCTTIYKRNMKGVPQMVDYKSLLQKHVAFVRRRENDDFVDYCPFTNDEKAAIRELCGYGFPTGPLFAEPPPKPRSIFSKLWGR